MLDPNKAYQAKNKSHERGPIDVRNYKSVKLYCGICGAVRLADVTGINTLIAHMKYKCSKCNSIR